MPEDYKGLGQFKAEAFLDEFVEQLKQRFGKELDFILLFGSAARGEFVLGKSDVDMVIQVKRDSAKKEVEEFAEKLFWELDKKHGMRLESVCSTGIGSSLLEQAIKLAERQVRLYKPFEVFGPKDIQWEKGRVKRLDLRPGATFVASQLILFYKMKHEGKILFGRDVRGKIKPMFSTWERLKGIWVPQTICFIAFAIAPLLPKKAVAYASKALFYEVESVNLFLKNKLPKEEERLQEFANATEFKNRLLDSVRFYVELKFNLLGEQKKAFVREAVKIKRQGFKGGRLQAMKFAWQTLGIIYSINTGIILKKIYEKKKPKKPEPKKQVSPMRKS